MSAVTYGPATTAAVDAPTEKKKRGFFTILYEAIAASQMLRAERELARCRHLLAPEWTRARKG